MKKLFFILALLAMAVTAGAQIVQTQSRITYVQESPKVTYPYNFFVKAGGGFLVSSDENTTTGGTFNAAFGYQRTTNSHGLYWGLQLGFTTLRYEYASYVNGYSYYTDKSKVSAYLGPMLGLKKKIGGSKVFDTHFGVAYQIPLGSCEDYYSYNGSYSDTSSGFISGLNYELGFGVWFGKFLVELQYRGFCNMTSSWGVGYTLNNGALINLGYKF